MRRNYITLSFLLLITRVAFGQSIIDSCFSSATPSIGFSSSSYLANTGSADADLLEWNGAAWIGGWPLADLTIPPPSNNAGCRAIFIGSSLTWTSGGEGFGLKLNMPLNVGYTYSFEFTYVSHGFGSDGAFGPRVYTSASPIIGNFAGNLPPVGYTWTTNIFSFTVTPAQAGDTWIIISTIQGGTSGMISSLCANCNDSAITNCNINLGNDTTLCQGETLLFDVSQPDASYLWQDNSTDPTLNIEQPGVYWVMVTASGCIATDTVIVSYNPLPTVDLGVDTTLCQGETLSLDVTRPNADYMWQDNSTTATFSIQQPGVYWVMVTANACSTSDTVNVSYNPLPIVDLGGDTALCQGEALLLDVTRPGGDYLWQNSSTGSTFNIAQPGTYWAMVTVNNCTATDTMSVSYNSLPAIDLGGDVILCQGDTLLLNATQPNATYLWQDNSMNSAMSVTEQGTYWVQLTLNGCVNTDSVKIRIMDCIVVIEMPNVFSPNNDGINDTFRPIRSNGIKQADFRIYNRWGQGVFETNNLSAGWNGKFSGSRCPDGTYFWIIEYTTIADESKVVKGALTLLK